MSHIQRRNQIKDVLSQDFPVPQELPYIEVKDDRVYRVHSVFHPPAVILPFSSEVITFVSSVLKGPHEEGEQWLVEEGFTKLFSIDKRYSVQDITATTEYFDGIQRHLYLNLFLLLGLFKLAQLFLEYYLMPKIQDSRRKRYLEDYSVPAIYREEIKIWERLSSVCLMSLKDLRHFLKARELRYLLLLPQPLKLEIDHYIKSKSPEHQRKSLIRAVTYGDERPIRRMATNAERAIYIADYMRQYAEEHDLRILHYLSGFSHESDIAYLLAHPEYRLPKL